MTMRAKDLGLYVHIPLCVRKCNYCDFCSYPLTDASWRERYVDLLCEEIKGYKGKDYSADTVFFGGGTPSLLSGPKLKRIMSSLRESFHIKDCAEITLEANPGAVTEEGIEDYISAGVNRISLGLQSIHENELENLGRIHSYTDFLKTFKLAREAGINNINVDLMYGIPNQTAASFSETLDALCELSPEHLSVYGLILEEGTPFYGARGSLNLPSADSECDMYELACKKLTSAGYNHYEISNYSRDGRASRHNLKYWRGEEYIGFGVSAYSYLGGVRFGNPRDIDLYLEGDRFGDVEKVDSPELLREEYIMLRLRLSEGFSLEEYRERFDRDFLFENMNMVKRLTEAGLAHVFNGRFSLTERGLYVSNSIICELL